MIKFKKMGKHKMSESIKAINNEKLNKEPRIGVFVCDCGTNIAGVVDVKAVVEFASGLDGVVLAEEGKWICSVDYLTKIKDFITENDLNRVVVACCTPRTHEPTFKATLKEAGLNPYLLEFVSIREQSSWVHKKNPKMATETAKDLVRMGVAKAHYLEPGEEIRIPVGCECLVIGGGIAGMTAALTLGDLGFRVLLVEQAGSLGGMLNKLYKLSPDDIIAKELLQSRIDRVRAHENITVFINAEITDIKGYVGNFTVKLEKPNGEDGSNIPQDVQEHKVSTIIVATGMRELEPIGMFGYGKFKNVLTQLQFEELLKKNDEIVTRVKEIAFINCVNSRNPERGCCNVGCISSIKNIKITKELNPDVNAYLFFRDFNITGMDVQYHYDSMDKYTAAFRYPEDSLPTVTLNEDKRLPSSENDKFSVQGRDILTGCDVLVNADLVVLTTCFVGDQSSQRLKGLLKVSTNPDGFFTEAHVKLRPLDFANEGIYICGCARSPKNVTETIEESIGAAMRAAIPMNRSFVETEGIVADANDQACLSCGICKEVCAFGAPELINNELEVIKAICKGCGTCVASCPSEAIDIIHYSDKQLLAQVDAALQVEPGDKILVFACHWCALGAVDNAGVSRFEYPANLRIIRVMCSGRVDPRFILRAFELGARGVLVAGCEIPTCHYITGNFYTSKKVELTRKLLEFVGIKKGRLRLEWLSAAEGAKFAQVAREFTEQLTELGLIQNDEYSKLDLNAALTSASGTRLRIIAAKTKEFVELGNEYGEVFTNHEVDRLLNEIVFDEFISNKIKELLKESSESIKHLSDIMSLPVSRIFQNIQTLIHNNEVELDRINGTTPIFKLITTVLESAKSKVQTEDLREKEPPPEVKVQRTNENKDFDVVIKGSTVEALNQALEHACDGDKVCLISPEPSFTIDHALLSKGFSGFKEYQANFNDLLDRIYEQKNIEILRNTLIERKFDNDEFTELQLLRRPTFIDEDKCDNCGLCSDACPVNLIDFDAFGLGTKHAIYHPWPKTKGVKFAISKGVPYCQASCAIAMDVRGYIGKIVDNDLADSAKIMRETNPLPDICGKVCDHLCENTCVRAYKDEPLEIRKLKRYAIESHYEHCEQYKQPLITKSSIVKNHDPMNRVAVIGSGPAGMVVAHDLARWGYPVTIYETSSKAGGMMRLGIPDYRLPSKALQNELDAIFELGIELKLNTTFGKDIKIDDLKAEGFKVVFISIGAHKSLALRIPGEELDGVINGLELLKAVNLAEGVQAPKLGKNVVVIGGGNVAIDCARTVRRLGVENVQILYRRTRQEMPADEEEINDCQAEGIKIEYLVTPKRLIGNKSGGSSGNVKEIECQRTKLGLPDSSGRRRPVIVDGSEFTLHTDSVIFAIGQIPDLENLNLDDRLEFSRRGTFIVDPDSGATNLEGVYVGGDAVTGPATVIDAIKSGKKCAIAIDQYLNGMKGDTKNIAISPIGERRTKELELLRLRKNLLLKSPEPECNRNPRPILNGTQRISNFAEVEQTLNKEAAENESKRCLSCRMCIGCGVCKEVCPRNAIDYSMSDERMNINAKKVQYYTKIEEGRFDDSYRLKELYKNSFNVLTPMELEYLLHRMGDFNNQLLRPLDGEVVRNIGFVFLPESDLITEKIHRLNNLELVYIVRLIKYINDNLPDIKVTFFSNLKQFSEIHELPKEFQYLTKNPITMENLKQEMKKVKDGEIQFNLQDSYETPVITQNDKTFKNDLIIVNTGLKFLNNSTNENL
jgi:heterodisulfide reductase subunit A-like polyferredoxin/coenzyme F420-reducing hydrogenase delta subunit